MWGSGYRNREVRTNRAHKFVACWTDADLDDICKIIVVSLSLWAQVTGRIVGLFHSHQQGLGLLCIAESNPRRDDASRFSSVVLTTDDSTKPFDCLSEGLDSQPAGLSIASDWVLECWGLRLDAVCPDVEPFGETIDEPVESWVCFQCGFEAIEYSDRNMRNNGCEHEVSTHWITSSPIVLNTTTPVSLP